LLSVPAHATRAQHPAATPARDPAGTRVADSAAALPARAPVPAAAAAFARSFELSVDRVHWGRAITVRVACAPGEGTPCAAGTPDVRVYTRWTPLATRVDMTRVHIPGVTGPYRVRVAPPHPQYVCESDASYPLPSNGFPITVRPSRPGGPLPIVCTWAVWTVVPATAGARTAYTLVESNTATVTVVGTR
jgi:hypothetical protein